MVDRPPFWPAFRRAILRRLDRTDDRLFWETVLNMLYLQAGNLARAEVSVDRVRTLVGRCCSWSGAPQVPAAKHESFVWPAGYYGPPWNAEGAPVLDWAVEGRWSPMSSSWTLTPLPEPVQSDKLTFRVSVPPQTSRHEKLVVHTVWTPGSPPRPTSEYHQSFGFRRRGSAWVCTVYKHSRDAGGFIFDPDELLRFDDRLLDDLA
jgi:hypothetical protein